MNFGTCPKCEESGFNKLVRNYPSDEHICDKCFNISCTGSLGHSGEELYIWYDGKEENGVEWYRKSRDKLIKKQNKGIIKAEKEKIKTDLETKHRIDNWK